MYESILYNLRDLRPSGKPNSWYARCPCTGNHKHGDSSGRGSLVVWINSKQHLRFLCYRGCGFKDIIDSLGISRKECFPPHSENSSRPKVKIVSRYQYKDEKGNLLFETLRLEPKDFRQRRMVKGKWLWTLLKGYYKQEGDKWVACKENEGEFLTDCRMVLFRLPEIVRYSKRSIIFCEGEKDVDTLVKLGLAEKYCITCNPLGAGKWRTEYNSFLADRHIAIFPDNDPVGKAHAAVIAGNAMTANAKGVRIIDLGEHKDVAEFALKESKPADKLVAKLRESQYYIRMEKS